jgi:7-carboxy-7-deazaguanine synthase
MASLSNSSLAVDCGTGHPEPRLRELHLDDFDSQTNAMQIAEIFVSLQGEGLLAGTPSTFVRTSGCNLRCVWCDTPYTSWEPEGEPMTVFQVLDRVRVLPPRHVVVTGGEPMLFPEAAELCRVLRREGFHVTVETAGTVLPDVAERLVAEPLADLMSISPKLSSSAPPTATPSGWAGRHQAARRRDDVLKVLMASSPYQLKFVVDTPADLVEALQWLEDLRAAGCVIDPATVCMMPQGRSDAELARVGAWLEPDCRRRGFHFAPRHHVAWFGHTRGT